VGLVVSADVEADHLLGVLVVVDGVAPLHKQGVQVKQVPWVVGWGETFVNMLVGGNFDTCSVCICYKAVLRPDIQIFLC